MSKQRELDWNDLRTFVRAAHTRTLAGAARALGVEHTTVGRRLTALERAFDAPLFIRSSTGLQLTSLGERLLPLAEDVDRAVQAVGATATKHRGQVRLAAPSGFAALITSRLEQLPTDPRRVSLELLSGSRPVDLNKGEAELALRIGPIADPNLVARNLGRVGWSLYASELYLARHPGKIHSGALAGHEVIGYDASLAAVPGATWLESHGAAARVVLRSREMTDMLAAAVAGVGLAVLPCILGETEPRLARLTRDVVGRRELSLVYRREVARSSPVRAVIEFVASVMREHAALISGEQSRDDLDRADR